MKILHILKTEPDDATNAIVFAINMPEEKDGTIIRLNDTTDYEQLIDLIFEHDKVITWW
jgi:hypothetical protein